MTKYYYVTDDICGAFYQDDVKVFEEKIEYIDDAGGLMCELRVFYPEDFKFVEVYDNHIHLYADDIDILDEDGNYPDNFDFSEVLEC